jgi:hypothetical protein
MKAMQKHLKKFRHKLSQDLCLERDIIVPVMEHLSKNDLLNCMLVCRQWNGMSLEIELIFIILCPIFDRFFNGTKIVAIFRFDS